MKKPTPKYYTASYGDMGLGVMFFFTKRETMRIVRELEKAHGMGELDSYTWGVVGE